MPVCKQCGVEKPSSLFLRNKWAEDLSGRGSYCKACGADPAVKHLAQLERARDWRYRDDAAYLAHKMWQVRQPDPAVVEERRRLALVKAAKLLLYAHRRVACVRCAALKPLTEFPKVKHNETDHSEVCRECWARDPEGVKGLQRERVRAYDRAMRRGGGERGDVEQRRAYRERREWEAMVRSRPAGYTREAWVALGKAGRIAVYAAMKGDRE